MGGGLATNDGCGCAGMGVGGARAWGARGITGVHSCIGLLKMGNRKILMEWILDDRGAFQRGMDG